MLEQADTAQIELTLRCHRTEGVWDSLRCIQKVQSKPGESSLKYRSPYFDTEFSNIPRCQICLPTSSKFDSIHEVHYFLSRHQSISVLICNFRSGDCKLPSIELLCWESGQNQDFEWPINSTSQEIHFEHLYREGIQNNQEHPAHCYAQQAAVVNIADSPAQKVVL